MSRNDFAKVKRVVVKIGSSLLTKGGQGLDKVAITAWVRQMAGLRQQSIDVVPYESMDTPVEAARKIIHEVEKWSDDLANKPRWLVLNKIDRLPAEEVEEHCQAIIDELGWTAPVFKIAAINGDGTRELMFAIMNFLEEQRRKDSEQE